MPVDFSDRLNFALGRLINLGGTAEGSNLPPLQRGEWRVPTVSAFRVATTQTLSGAIAYILAWDEPEDIAGISHFNIYATEIATTGLYPSAPVAVPRSPARLEYEVAADSILVFSIQTVLTNGMVSDPLTSPCCTWSAEPTEPGAGSITPSMLSSTPLLIPNLSLTSNSPGAGRIAWSSFTIYYLGSSYSISSGSTPATEKFVYWNVGDTTLTSANSFTPVINRFLIATNDGGTADTAWNKLATKGIQDANILEVAALKVTGQLTASQIAAAAIDATKINIKQIIVTSLTLTSNSPSAGKVAWSACTVYFQGTAYSISSGSTSSTDHKFIYWTSGGGTFTSADSYTPSDTVFLIATNTAGAAAEAWNRGGTALSAIQESNLATSLLKGFSIETPATAAITLNSAATSTIVNISGAGALLTIGLELGGVQTSAATPDTVIIHYSADGATAKDISLLRGDGAGVVFTTTAKLAAASLSGTGAASGDSISIYLGITFTTSLLVTVQTYNNLAVVPTTSATAGVMYAVKTN